MRAHSFIVIAALAGATLAGCGNEAPLFPTYSHDIQPIMAAHCVRCHGAGGMLNADPDIPLISGVRAPKTTDLSSYAKLMPLAPALKTFIDSLPMPPPPSTALTSYDYDTIVTWGMNPQP